ncbi:MAG: hypothetical protein R3229_18230 [Alphaproteobacteria bacterium]|nr:hypothetical protein [Alphaproteobacteria bacterium]
MTKPVLRLIHNLARAGGTIINRCVGSMAGVFLLSEINPRGLHRFNPIFQADRWFNLLSPADLNSIGDPHAAGLNSMIKLIHQRVEERGGHLILRDWNHLDFLAVPFESKPTNRLSLAEAMSDDFELRQIAIVRHPLDQARSTVRILPKNNIPTAEYIFSAQRRFAEAIYDIGFIRYEDFVLNPDLELRKICTALDVAFDPEYREKWPSYKNITGDTESVSMERSAISMSQRKRQSSPEFMKKLLSNADYRKTCEILNYPIE